MSNKMKVAIAGGAGNVAQYLIQELQSYGHDIVVLTRNPKPEEKRFEQRKTDYSVASLVEVLQDRDALVSTVTDYTDLSVGLKVHLNMLEACKQSGKCKKFIPSAWTSNEEDHPEHPIYFAKDNEILHQRLREERESVMSTIISNAWFMEYMIPATQRYLRDVGPIWPGDWNSKVFTIYGSGTQRFTLTSVRDVAKAVAALIGTEEPWEFFTYLSGEQVTWNDLFDILKKNDLAWTSRNKPLTDTINEIVANESPMSVLVAQFEIQSYAGALTFRPEKVARQRARYFSDIHFRTVQDLVDEAGAKPGQII